MNIQEWLGDIPKQEFVARFYQQSPFSRAAGTQVACQLAQWPTVARILADQDVDALVVRQGQPYTGQVPAIPEEVQRLCEQGHTILIRHAERHDRHLAELAHSFALDFGAPVNIHLYATPGQTFGFGWHYDAEDVFILQTAGTKEYSLRKNTVNPWPLEETLPTDMKYEREIMPLMKCLLSPGDWLYIPFGYWHMGHAQGEEISISIALGVTAPAAISIFDALRPRLLESLLWRQRLPVSGSASPKDAEAIQQQYREVVQQLSADLVRQLADDGLLRELLR